MLKVSRRLDYATRVMVELGMAGNGQRLASYEVAERAEVPEAFLRKIVADLAKSGLLRTFSGPGGGLALGRNPDAINLWDIYEAVEGPLILNDCLIQPEECSRDLFCPTHRFWGRLQGIIIKEMSEWTLGSLVEKGKSLQENPTRVDMVYRFFNEPV